MGFFTAFAKGLITGGAKRVARTIDEDITRQKNLFDQMENNYINEVEQYKQNRKQLLYETKENINSFKSTYDLTGRLGNRELFALAGTEDQLATTQKYIESLTPAIRNNPEELAQTLKNTLNIAPDVNKNTNKMTLEQLIQSNLPKFKGIRPKVLSTTTAYGIPSTVQATRMAEFEARYPKDTDPLGQEFFVTDEERAKLKVTKRIKPTELIPGTILSRVDISDAIKRQLQKDVSTTIGGKRYTIIPGQDAYGEFTGDISFSLDNQIVKTVSPELLEYKKQFKLNIVKNILKTLDKQPIDKPAANSLISLLDTSEIPITVSDEDIQARFDSIEPRKMLNKIEQLEDQLSDKDKTQKSVTEPGPGQKPGPDLTETKEILNKLHNPQTIDIVIKDFRNNDKFQKLINISNEIVDKKESNEDFVELIENPEIKNGIITIINKISKINPEFKNYYPLENLDNTINKFIYDSRLLISRPAPIKKEKGQPVSEIKTGLRGTRKSVTQPIDVSEKKRLEELIKNQINRIEAGEKTIRVGRKTQTTENIKNNLIKQYNAIVSDTDKIDPNMPNNEILKILGV